MTLIRADRISAAVQTYTSVAFYSWGARLIGKVVTLSWNAMTSTQFNALDAIFQADATVVFNPTDIVGGSTTYNVEIVSLNGEYLAGVLELRINCTMELLIMSVI
jgi:hypothetical protein